MDSIFITSTVSVRTRGPLSFPFNDYTCYSNDRFGRYPCAYSSHSSVRTCCNCLSNSTFKLPLTPNCNCYLYGSRQSNLIQWVPRKKLTFSSFDRSYYARLPVCDVNRSCYCDKVCGIRDRNVGGRRVGLRKCRVSDESSKRGSFGGVDEAEVLLSLLAEDLDEECYDASEKDERVNKKVVVQRKGNGETSNWRKTKTKRVDSGILTSESKFDHKSVVLRSKKEDKRKIEERIRREKDREDQRRKEIIKTQRKEEEREALLRRNNRANEEEKENLLRKENWKVKAVEDEKNYWLRREEHKERMRREGSSSSSYYSLSSAGEYNTDGEIEGVGEGSGVESSIAHEKDMKRSDKIISEEVGKEEYGAGLRKKSTEIGFYGGSSGIESDFRKKSEKKMTDVMIEVVKSAEKSYDDGKVESTSGMKFDEEKRRKGNEIVDEYQTGMKYKQFTEMPSNRDDEALSYYGSQKLFSDREEKFAKEHSTMVDTRKASKMSKPQEIDDRKASVSQQLTETRLKKKEAEEYSTDIITSKYDIEKKQQSEKTQQSDLVTGLVNERGNSNRLTKKESSCISPMQPESRVAKQEESVNLAYGKYMESKEQQFERHEESSSRTNVKIGTQERTNESITIVDKTGSQTEVAPPSSQSEARGELGVSSTGGVKIEEVTDEKDGGAKNEGPEKPSEFISNQDSLPSAEELQKSSAHYVDEFVEKVRHEISTSEIHEEKRTYESKVESKEHHSRHSSRGSKTRGPSDETWEINEPSVKEQSRTEVQDDDSKRENAILKRTGRSMWSIIGDIFLLKWSPRSESHSTHGKPVGVSSNQSTSSEAWFSGHEAEEEGESERKERNISQEPSSSTIEAYAKHERVDTLSSSTVQESGPKSLTPLPAMRLRRSPMVKEASGATEASSSGSDPTEVKKDVKLRKLQRNEQIPKDRFDEWEEAYRVGAEQRKVDEMFMREALLEAKKAADNWEVPVGAVLVQGGKIIARGCNLVEELRDSTAHAEMICIREASGVLRTWRLSETTLYVTLEPCPMCAGAILQARIDTVVWGAPNKLLGADGSWISLFPSGDGGNELEQTDRPPAPVHPFHPKMTIRRGVLSTECADAMQQFFQLRRRKKEKKPEPPTPPSCLPVSHRPSKFFAKMHDAFNIMFCL